MCIYKSAVNYTVHPCMEITRVRYADCLRQRHRVGPRALKRSLSVTGISPRLRSPIKPRLIRVTRQLNISPFARKGQSGVVPRNPEPRTANSAHTLALSVAHTRKVARRCVRRNN